MRGLPKPITVVASIRKCMISLFTQPNQVEPPRERSSRYGKSQGLQQASFWRKGIQAQ